MIFFTKKCILDTQKNHLNEMVLLSTQNIVLYVVDEKVFNILKLKQGSHRLQST